MTNLKQFRILFEDSNKKGYFGWTTISDCVDIEDAMNYFMKQFKDREIVSVRQIRD